LACEDTVAMEPGKITMEELKKHNKMGDCWIRLGKKVYDVSNYMADHPGGYDMMLDNTNGVDATEEYELADHSKRARQMADTYYIGELADE